MRPLRLRPPTVRRSASRKTAVIADCESSGDRTPASGSGAGAQLHEVDAGNRCRADFEFRSPICRHRSQFCGAQIFSCAGIFSRPHPRLDQLKEADCLYVQPPLWEVRHRPLPEPPISAQETTAHRRVRSPGSHSSQTRLAVLHAQ